MFTLDPAGGAYSTPSDQLDFRGGEGDREGTNFREKGRKRGGTERGCPKKSVLDLPVNAVLLCYVHFDYYC